MTTISQAVKLAVERGGVDSEWRSEENIGDDGAKHHRANECFALCSGDAARRDYYEMWTPQYRKAKAA